jgi:hypothetical protein
MFGISARSAWARRVAPALVTFGFVANALGVQPQAAQALIRQGEPWPGGKVQVCWRADADDHDYFANNARLVRDLVENGWGRAANIQFSGWGVCPTFTNDDDPPRTVQIHWSEDDGGKGPHADYGYFIDKRTFVRLRNIEDYNDRTQFPGDVLHEFGHALGFGHEQNHPQRGSQAAGVCDPAVTVTAEALTPFDQYSVMGYCSTALNTLSPLDIVGAQNEYGRKPAGALVGLGNRCLDIPSSSPAIGTPLQVFTCNGTPNQVWSYASDATLSATTSGQQRCIEVPNSALSPNSGTILKTDTCNARGNQLFGFKNMELRGYGDYCVDVPSANYAAGQFVQLSGCNGGGNQQWSLIDGRSIKSGASNLCLEVPNATAAVGKLLRLASCTYGAAQRFTFTSLGEMRFGGLCVDARTDTTPALQLYTCKPNDVNKRNQQWYLSGPIHGLGGQCLDIRGGRGYDGSPVQLFPCTGGDNQRWNYYFR